LLLFAPFQLYRPAYNSMKHSLSYHLTLFVLKLKGLKKNFSQDPIDYKKIRKEDKHEPKGRLLKTSNARRFNVAASKITALHPSTPSDKLLLFIHGGAFISGPAQHHWDSIKTILSHSDHTIWMCDYPKAPETEIGAISDNIDEVYAHALGSYPSSHITLIGDSVGGTLITSLVQRLIKKGHDLPSKLILISPVMDARMTNPEIVRLDPTDPILSRAGVLSAKKLCAGQVDLGDPMISPINGEFDGFPPTTLFLATNDITYPDQMLAVDKLKSSSASVEVIEGKGMPHIWPLLPVMKEAKEEMREIIRRLNN